MKTIDTGFSRHIDLLVDGIGKKPDRHTIAECRRILGARGIQRWFNVSGMGFDKDWIWVIGIA